MRAAGGCVEVGMDLQEPVPLNINPTTDSTRFYGLDALGTQRVAGAQGGGREFDGSTVRKDLNPEANLIQ